MELSPKCPRCHTEVRTTDYFCFNCGKNLKPAPPRTDAAAQIILYLKSFLIPPFGIFWALKYLKQSDYKSRVIGITAVILTLVSFIITIKLFNDFMKELNSQLDQSLNGLYR